MANILSIVPYKFSPPVNGGHWGVIIIEKSLSVYNNVLTVATSDNSTEKPYPFTIAPILSNKKKRYIPFSGADIIEKAAIDHKADYIFLHHHYMFFTALKVAKKLNIPLYIRSHNIESLRFKSLGKSWWKIMYWYEKWAYNKADKIFFVTEDDKEWAIKNFKTKRQNTDVMPFGIDFTESPEKPNNKISTAQSYGLNAAIPWFFFMGMLDYTPNTEAVLILINEILPRIRQGNQSFHLIIFGKNLSDNIQEQLKSLSINDDVVYLGFVEDLGAMLSSCDVMLNPVLSGGGVKTKVIESLAWNKTVISTHSGALGIDPKYCNNKLQIVADNDWQQFANAALNSIKGEKQNISSTFFEYYASENIAKRMQIHFENTKTNKK